MIRITERDDLKGLKSYPKAYDYISALLDDLLCDYSEYCADRSIRAIGAIYFMESIEDFDNYTALGLEQSIQDTIIEWTNIKDDICVICIVISTDYAIDIVCDVSLYNQWQDNKEQV